LGGCTIPICERKFANSTVVMRGGLVNISERKPETVCLLNKENDDA